MLHKKSQSQKRLVFLCSKLCLPPRFALPPRGRLEAVAQVLPLSGAGVPHSSRKRPSLQSIDSQEILAELTQSNNAVILPNTLKISNLSCEIFVAEEGP